MSQSIPKYRRHPNGQAFVRTVRLNSGRPVYLGRYGTEASRAEYRRVLALLDVSDGPVSTVPTIRDGRQVTIVELIAAYTVFAERYYSVADKQAEPVDGVRPRKTTKEYDGMVRALRPLEELFGTKPGCEFGPLKLAELQDFMVKKGWARTTINKRIARVRRFFRWCCKKELLPAPIYQGLICVDPLVCGRCEAPEPPKVVPVPRSVVNLTLPFLSQVTADMVQVQLLCGMRPAELCRLKMEDVDTSQDIWLYSPPEHKNAWRELTRIIAIPKTAQRLLAAYIDRPRDQCLFSPRESERQRNGARGAKPDPNRKTKIYPCELRARAKAKLARRAKVSKRPKRPQYDTDSYRRAIDYAITKAKRAGVIIPHWAPNQLRHAISTEISQTVGLGEQAAQRWLGHEHLETTGIYTQKQVAELIEIAKALDRKWAG